MISRILSYIRVSVFVDSYSILHRIVCLASLYSEITIFNINEPIIYDREIINNKVITVHRFHAILIEYLIYIIFDYLKFSISLLKRGHTIDIVNIASRYWHNYQY